MTKITRKKLARGAKLLVDHIFSPLQAIQYVVTGVGDLGVEAEQLEAGYAPFHVNLSIPHVGSYSNSSWTPDNVPHLHCIPFMLPPLQEDLDFTANARTGNTPTINASMPDVILDEVSVSFDTRCEPAAIVSNWGSGNASQGADANEGRVAYERVPNYNLRFAILEKRPTWGQSAPTNMEPTLAIWSGGIVADPELSSGYIRTGNPYVVTDIRRAIDPYTSYIFTISAPDLSDTYNMELVSLEISMRFLAPIRERDSGTNIQNILTRHLGERPSSGAWTATGAGQHSSTPRPLITSHPLPGANIEANTATGVQTSMAVIDEIMRSKLRGGYNMHSEVPVRESMLDTAAYTVLAVPLFNNTRYGGISLPNPAGTPVGFPYVTSTGGSFIDRRYIPIVAPMTIHHVLFTWSWMPFTVPAGGGGVTVVREVPGGAGTSEELELEIGVGMGTGARADMFGYEQIARKTLTNVPSATWVGVAIDQIRYSSVSTIPLINGGIYDHNLEIHSMDIEGSGQPGLNGMTAQGYPVFVGRSLAGVGGLLARQRENMQATGTDAKTLGAEQWLEVRAKVSDVNGDWSTGWKADQMIAGAGGIWVYIIGKTHLV